MAIILPSQFRIFSTRPINSLILTKAKYWNLTISMFTCFSWQFSPRWPIKWFANGTNSLDEFRLVFSVFSFINGLTHISDYRCTSRCYKIITSFYQENIIEFIMVNICSIDFSFYFSFSFQLFHTTLIFAVSSKRKKNSHRWILSECYIFSYHRLAKLALGKNTFLALARISHWKNYRRQTSFWWFCLGTKNGQISSRINSDRIEKHPTTSAINSNSWSLNSNDFDSSSRKISLFLICDYSMFFVFYRMDEQQDKV